MMREKAEQVLLGYKKEILSTKGYIIYSTYPELFTPKWYWGYYECISIDKDVIFAITPKDFENQIYELKQEFNYSELDGEMPPELVKKIAELRFVFETQHPLDGLSNCPFSEKPWYRWASDDELLKLLEDGQLEAGKSTVETMNESERQELIKYVQQIEEKRKKK